MIHCKESLIGKLISNINIHEALCTEHFWLNVALQKAEHEADPCEHISSWPVIDEGKIVCRCGHTQFYKFDSF